MVLPLGAKGSALSLVMSVLGGFLVASGQSRDSDLPDLDTDRPGHFLMAINVEHFVRLSDFQAEIDERIHEIRNGTPAPGPRARLCAGRDRMAVGRAPAPRGHPHARRRHRRLQ